MTFKYRLIRFPLNRLSSRLIFFVSIGIIISTIALYLFISSTQQKLTFESFYTSTNGTLQAAKLGIELGHSEEKYEMLVQVFNWIKTRDHFKFIYLTEKIDDNEEILIGFPETENTPISFLNSQYDHRSIDDSVFVLKTAWESKIGTGNMFIGFSTNKLRMYEQQVVFDLTTFGLISVVIIILIVAVITASVTKPLKRLKEVTERIRKGNLNDRADEKKGGIEVTSVSKAFNQMVEELSRTQKELSNEIYEAAVFIQSILPEPIKDKIKVDWRFLPSRDLGGDSFGYHYLDESHLAIYLIDVSGHGVGPALLSVSVINILRNQSLTETDFYNPGSVLYSLNNIFQMDKNGDKYFTAWYGVLNKNTLELNFSAAGHPPAVLVHEQDGEKSIEELEIRNNFVGFLPDIEFDCATKQLNQDDRLFIYSDGLYEIIQSNGKVLEKEMFLEVVLGCSESLDAMLIQLRDYEKNNQFSDDCSVIRLSV